MKRFTAIAILVCILTSCFFVADAQEQDVKGFHENMQKLWMVNNYSDEELEKISEDYTAYMSDYLKNYYVPATFELYKNRYKTFEEEYEYQMHIMTPDYSTGLKVSIFNPNYQIQYIENNCMDYLILDHYWNVQSKNYEGANMGFDSNGIPIDENKQQELRKKYTYYFSHPLKKEVIDFLRNEEAIEAMLLEKDETAVNDIYVFYYETHLAILYIDGEINDYFIKIYDFTSSKGEYNLENIEFFKLYTIDEFYKEINSALNVDVPRAFIERTNQSVTNVKNTFTKEAEILQSEGLLYGNENGLDLLKPLTRIEAAAIILRAVGLDDAVILQSDEIFSDVPQNHWEFETALIAAQEGLILGNGDGTFSPNKQITSNEFATMVLRCSNIKDFNWENALNILVEQEIITVEDTKDMALFTRGDMAKIIYEARNKRLITQ